MHKHLVSILIPAYNAAATIGETLQSALAQTWPHKEIIVVDDGSKDATVAVAREFGANVRVAAVANQGAAAARNHALSLSQGDFIQWLDADDILAPDKIERQIQALPESDGASTLLSSPWAPFYYRTRRAKFIHNALCQDLAPTEWLLRKMSHNLHMQTATWLTSRKLAEAAGPWDTRLLSDDDGEYFCRVLLASKGVRYVAGTGVFYRISPSNRLSYVGSSDKKRDAMVTSMKLHIQYLRSLEESERVRMASLTYLQNWYPAFYPDRPDIMVDLQQLAASLGGQLSNPQLRWKYRWMQPFIGSKKAREAQAILPQIKSSLLRGVDRVAYRVEARSNQRMRSPYYV